METDHNKYSEAEMVVLTFALTLPLDVICALIDATQVGMAIAPFIQAFGTGALTVYGYFSKGDKGSIKLGRQITKQLANVIPYLPTLTATLWIEAYMHNHPEKFAAVQKAMGAAGGKPGAISSTKDIAKTAKQMGIPSGIE